MNKKLLLPFLLLSLILIVLVSCQPVPRCNNPYILVGTSCCLDQNDNSICDSDEPELKPTLVDEPQVVEEPQEIAQTFTINDLQADIGNVLGKNVFLTKDNELDTMRVYSSKISKLKLLGTYSGSNFHYYKIMTLKPELIIEITSPDDYLVNLKSFKDFVSENKNVFVQTALNSKEIFEHEFKEWNLPELIFRFRGEPTSETAKYIGHSERSSVFYDEITFPETISGNIAEVRSIKVNSYKVNVSDTKRLTTFSKPKYTQELSNINYGQSIVVQCSPNIVIALSVEDYGSAESVGEKNYNFPGLTKDFFSTPLNRHFNLLIKDAQALLKMCEQRYQSTYIRGR